MTRSGKTRRSGGRKKAHEKSLTPTRKPNYIRLRHPFEPQTIFSDDEIFNIHETALKVLEELGIKVLLPEARDIFKKAGARVKDEMAFIGRDIVSISLNSAPNSIKLCAANPKRALIYEDGALIFSPGAGCPNANDRNRGRRPGDLNSYIETLKLHQSYDIIHKLGPSTEPQDVPTHLRHYAMMQAQMEFSDKPMFVYARGSKQTEQSFEMIRLALNLSEEDWNSGTWGTTVINSNSPRMLDKPMAQGIIDFARAKQMSIITPFCLAGAMAPITVSGALTLQHAEALAGIALAQLVNSGAPVSYGGFASNVDMKSGSPAFGTPEHIKLQIGSGQLARHIDLPWRSAAGSASNIADTQGATENISGVWGALMANATLTIHAAGWLEGGLTFGYEKFITDIEALQTVAELCKKTEATDSEIGFDAIKDVDPGGHFFATQHTMDRYSTEFYSPIISDLSNNGSWIKSGSKTATERATGIWESTLQNYVQPTTGYEVPERLASFIEKRTSEGGAPIME